MEPFTMGVGFPHTWLPANGELPDLVALHQHRSN